MGLGLSATERESNMKRHVILLRPSLQAAKWEKPLTSAFEL